MATGTEAGLTRDKRAQSVFKHKILERYVLPYAAMTASICTPKRCVVVDGFAGRARYDDGSAASAERMMVEAHKLPGLDPRGPSPGQRGRDVASLRRLMGVEGQIGATERVGTGFSDAEWRWAGCALTSSRLLAPGIVPSPTSRTYGEPNVSMRDSSRREASWSCCSSSGLNVSITRARTVATCAGALATSFA